jgi:predicted acylesterase/phospholipase RssA
MSKLLRILSIDGGGIRGILPGLLLASLEKKLQQRAGNPNARVADHFDLIAGTSTGGILTCLYLCPGEHGRPRFAAAEAVDLYLEKGQHIFRAPSNPIQRWRARKYECKYVVIGMNELLESYFRDLRLSQLLKPSLITSYDIINRRSFFFTQHDADKNPDYDFYVKDITRATSAAPGYFEPARVRSMAGTEYTLLDGGVFANNPALCAYAEAMQHFGKQEMHRITPGNLLLVSIGSGVFRNGADEDPRSMAPVQHVMAGVTETVDFQLKQLFSSAGCEENYFRFDPELGNASQGLDDCSTGNLQALQEAGMQAVEMYDKALDSIAERLVPGTPGKQEEPPRPMPSS